MLGDFSYPQQQLPLQILLLQEDALQLALGIELAGHGLLQPCLDLDNAVEERPHLLPQLLVFLLEVSVDGQQLLVILEGLEDAGQDLLLAGEVFGVGEGDKRFVHFLYFMVPHF
jgi:hypothetical protein